MAYLNEDGNVHARDAKAILDTIQFGTREHVNVKAPLQNLVRDLFVFDHVSDLEALQGLLVSSLW